MDCLNRIFQISASCIDKQQSDLALSFLSDHNFVLIFQMIEKCFHSVQLVNPMARIEDRYLLKILWSNLLIFHSLMSSFHHFLPYFLPHRKIRFIKCSLSFWTYAYFGAKTALFVIKFNFQKPFWLHRSSSLPTLIF